ncbi:eCIS core domain-containing protein [Hyalangium versicolor]|uniref:eCIS core domain-containing protein n=1 Tax=Hyalangium versicolor TaxID=2861190 RepID=UPI001CCBCD28|nr:DUF4157 domain-containing protein [Hyalangium versicolor]
MFANGRKPPPSAAHAPSVKPASERPQQAPVASPPWFQLATSNQAGAADSPEATAERRRYFEPRSPPPPPRIQFKLQVGAPDDVLEREADAVADTVVNGIQRKCSACEHEDEVQRGLIQRKATSGFPMASPGLQSQLSSTKGQGHSLPSAVGSFMGSALGTSFEQVRVHTGESAAQMNSALSARAFTHGTDIYFNRGEYNPGSRAGQHLLAHELAHVAQQQGADNTLRREGGAPGNVSLVEISCPNNTITFHSNQGDISYRLNQCDIVAGEFDANVVIDKAKSEVRFDIQSDKVASDAFKFGFEIGPGQKNPIVLFGSQKTVKISAQTGVTTVTAATTLAEFKTMVKEAGKLRMDGNKAHLEEWKTFFTQKLSTGQLQGQVMANRASQLATLAANEGGMSVPTFDKWTKTDNPLLAWVYEQQIEGRYRACTGCHAMVQAEARWRDRPSYVTAPPSPGAVLQEHAAQESANPAPRPVGLGQENAIADLNKFTGYDSALQAMQAVKTLRPYLDELGPARYDVLPLDVFTSMKSPAELLAKIVSSIQKRQASYDLFKTKIESPDFDYLLLRPIVQDLLPLATPEVQQQVADEIATAQKWEVVKAIVVGAATIGLIVAAVFPPTSALGIAGITALEASLATYGVYSGIEMYQQGSLLALGKGANNVLDPEQQKSADTMMALGLVTVGMSALSLGASGVKAISLIRGANNGTKALGAVTSIEARLENGGTVKITELVGGKPKVFVLGKDGELLAEGELTDAVLTGKPVKMSDLPANGIKGATPRAGTEARPVSFQGQAPTCGSVSCEMVASMGGPVKPELVRNMLKEAGTTGVTTDQMVAMLKWNKVASEAKVGWKVADLASATEKGNPAIAVIRTTNPTHPLHAVVVDGVTVRGGVRVVAIRNPWGIQYFQSEAEFAKIFTGNAVKILHWY